MKKFMVLGALVAMVLAALAIPAMAQDRNIFGDQARFGDDRQGLFEERQAQRQDLFEDWVQRFEDQGFFSADSAEEDNGNWWDDNDNNWWDDNNWWNDNHNSEPAVSQDFSQQVESGDVNQSFNVSNSGSNSNQCVGINGIANTGNVQNQTGIIQYGSAADDFQFEDSGATLNVGGNSNTNCSQQVNQAAAAG